MLVCGCADFYWGSFQIGIPTMLIAKIGKWWWRRLFFINDRLAAAYLENRLRPCRETWELIL